MSVPLCFPTCILAVAVKLVFQKIISFLCVEFMHHSDCVEVRRSFAGMGSHLSFHGALGLNSGHQASWQVSLVTEPSCGFLKVRS